MAGVISKIIAGICVGKYGEVASIYGSPYGELTELLRGKCELATPARVRSYRTLMETTDLGIEDRASMIGKVPGERKLRLIEVDVCMKIQDGHNVARHSSNFRHPLGAKRKGGSAHADPPRLST